MDTGVSVACVIACMHANVEKSTSYFELDVVVIVAARTVHLFEMRVGETGCVSCTGGCLRARSAVPEFLLELWVPHEMD